MNSSTTRLLSADQKNSSLTGSQAHSQQPAQLVPILFNKANSADERVTTDEPSSQPTLHSTRRDRRGQEVRIFFSTFVTILLAELGDKTQLATLLMSAESQSPWIVFMGAGFALIATSLLGVLVGCWLSKTVSPRTLETASGAILLLVSVLLLWDVVHL